MGPTTNAIKPTRSGWLKILRLSNWPTLVSNSLAAAAMAQVDLDLPWIVALFAGLMAYSAGMVLNDFFDFSFDKIHQPFRPIVKKEISLTHAGGLGIFFLLSSFSLFLVAQFLSFDGLRLNSTLITVALLGVIVFYDKKHKGNPFAPLLMGLCRGLLLLAVAFSLSSHQPTQLFLMASVMTLYVSVITFAGPWLGPSMSWAIAAISLVDSAWLWAVGRPGLTIIAMSCFPATLYLQKWVRGT